MICEAHLEGVGPTPEQITILRECTHSVKSKARRYMLDQGLPVDEFLPKQQPGRVPQPLCRIFPNLSIPLKKAVAAAIEKETLPITMEEWDSPEMSDRAATAIIEYYNKPSSASISLSQFRKGLRVLGCPLKIINTTLRPETTRLMNDQCEVRRGERATEGLVIPELFQRIADLTTRVEGYLDSDEVPTGQFAADFLVVFSARPGELSTLDLGARGGVIGVLKKRGVVKTYNIVSALTEPTAIRLLQLWRTYTSADRRRAMKELKALVGGWGIQRRDLRAIGAHLAVRSAVLNGEVATTVEARDVHQSALRHETWRRAAVDNYARVVDDATKLAAQVAELPKKQRVQIATLIHKPNIGEEEAWRLAEVASLKDKDM